MSKSSSMSRQVAGYPAPKYFRLFTAYAKVNEMSKSETLEQAIREMFDRMPESERQRILHLAENPIAD